MPTISKTTCIRIQCLNSPCRSKRADGIESYLFLNDLSTSPIVMIRTPLSFGLKSNQLSSFSKQKKKPKKPKKTPNIVGLCIQTHLCINFLIKSEVAKRGRERKRKNKVVSAGAPALTPVPIPITHKRNIPSFEPERIWYRYKKKTPDPTMLPKKKRR